MFADGMQLHARVDAAEKPPSKQIKRLSRKSQAVRFTITSPMRDPMLRRPRMVVPTNLGCQPVIEPTATCCLTTNPVNSFPCAPKCFPNSKSHSTASDDLHDSCRDAFD